MTREEIKAIAKNEGHSLTFPVYSEAFNKKFFKVFISTLDWNTGEKENDLDKLVTDYVSDCVNNFLQLDKSKFIDRLKDEVYRIFNIYIEAASYAQVPDDLIEKHGNTEANRIFFNGRNRDTVFESCNFYEAYYIQDSGPNLYYSVYIKVDWEMEHGLTVIFENGDLVNIE